MELTDAVAVVTGAAAGIGRATATGLAAAGAHVVVADIDEAGLAGTARLVSAQGRRAQAVSCDVTRDADIARLADTAHRLTGTVQVVVANAGVAVGGQSQHVPVAEWARVLDVNVLGVARTVKAFLPGLIAARRGSVAITSSAQGLFAESGAGMVPYVTTKAALIGMARSLGAEVRPLGVNVTLLCPGLTATAFPASAIIWGPAGASSRHITVPDDADSAEQVAQLLVDAIRADRFLASAIPGTPQQLMAWARDPDAALPGLPAQTGIPPT
jgi:NAD(P)-dependent dehydrogenase (short-subunit alcohol dehydrogenase family)